MIPRKHRLAALGALALLGICTLRTGHAAEPRFVHTIGEVQVVHAELRIGGRPVRGVVRFAIGETLATGPEGRGRLRLDDGTNVVLDRSTRIQIGATGLALEAGRIFVLGGARAHTTLTLGAASTLVSASALGLERDATRSAIYCASGEAVVRAHGKQARMRSGESASISASALEVAPEKVWNDWTGGMATPWSASGRPRAAIAELWARSSVDDALALAVRSHAVNVTFQGELARTRVETSFFNAGRRASSGTFRMALPDAAIVSRFAVRSADGYKEGSVLAGAPSEDGRAARLEWAGPGQLRGDILEIASGASLSVIVEYVEWLSVVEGRMTYRYPMLSDASAPSIGELTLHVDVSGAKPHAIAASGGASLRGDFVELHQSDVRPEADFVVELTVPAPALDRARAYVVGPGRGDPAGDPYVLLRAPLPAADAHSGVALALVLDTSWSTTPANLEAGRALIEAILEGLGAQDRVAVLAADQDARAIGPAGCLPVDEARRRAVGSALASLRPAGASDLGAAFEQASDLLPADASGAMLVYIGDGRPSVGETNLDALRARLARRAGGVPRLAAVSLGRRADRAGLARLVLGSGPVLQVSDRAEAAQVAVSLLASTLEAVVDEVELDLGPNIDRVYPRAAQTLPDQGVAMAIGRLRGALPGTIGLRYRRAGQRLEETRPLDRSDPSQAGDIRRRWLAARIDEAAVRGEDPAASADLAQRASLLTAWTGYYIDAAADHAPLTPLAERLWESEGASEGLGALFEPQAHESEVHEDYRALISASARRTLQAAAPQLRRCRDARSALQPELGSNLQIRLTLDGQGRASQVRVQQAGASDAALELCVAMLVKSLSFFDSGTVGTISLEHELRLPPLSEARARTCSPTSRLPLALRRSIWAERLRTDRDGPSAQYQRARRSCELPGWPDQRALLELMLDRVSQGAERVALAAELRALNESDAAQYAQRAAIERCRNHVELAAVRRALFGVEPRPGPEFERQYRAAADDGQRLHVVRRFLRLSPHDPRLLRALLSLLEAQQQTAALVEEIQQLRSDAFVDAGVLADGAAILQRLGRAGEARRAFGELIERAPNDPYARAYAGDRLRDAGLFDDAAAAYEALVSDPGHGLRLALAHAGAGRLDLATRILERVARTGGRNGEHDLGELASTLDAVLLAEARGRARGDERARLDRRALEVALPDVAGLVLVRTPRLDAPLTVRMVRAGGDASEITPDLAAPSLGLFVLRLERGERDVRVLLRRPQTFSAQRSIPIEIDVLSIGEDRSLDTLLHRELEIAPDGRDREVRWQGGTLL